MRAFPDNDAFTSCASMLADMLRQKNGMHLWPAAHDLMRSTQRTILKVCGSLELKYYFIQKVVLQPITHRLGGLPVIATIFHASPSTARSSCLLKSLLVLVLLSWPSLGQVEMSVSRFSDLLSANASHASRGACCLSRQEPPHEAWEAFAGANRSWMGEESLGRFPRE